MSSPARRVAPLLFGSGACALVYQVTWLRELRLVFGASTEASAAVLAVFIGGLGLGGLLIGPRADRRRSPLLLYARLEAAIALSAAITPLLLVLVRRAYVGLGGSTLLGAAGGTGVRLLLTALVLALPTLLMGGTLPAAARAVETAGDARRRGVALLYGVNTLGAVFGSFAATFFLLETFGNRRTLWLACAVNFAVALIARAAARRLPDARGLDSPAEEPAPGTAPPLFVLSAAGIVGFAFFLMELVWYRMLGPLLGGSVFTFGLILTIALLGIGLGGWCYSLLREDQPARLSGFALTCLLEALFVALPFALGDRLALLAAMLRTLGNLGFWGHVLGWSGVASIVVLPAAFVSGVQFPMLVALLGRGRTEVGRQLGRTYAWNTLGAIAGSLAGGFGLLPLLTAPGCWRAVSLLLLLLGVAALALSWQRERMFKSLLAPAACGIAVVPLLFSVGPTSAWRHSGVGVGRAAVGGVNSPNGMRAFLHAERRALLWETDGVESSVALLSRQGMAFAVNGKIDGHATLDAPTQVMSGVLGALLHKGAKTSLVIGLGTGSTAGWLGIVPGMERVDAVELERGVLEVARQCAAVNQNVLANPRVRVLIGDAREVLLTSPERYDLIFSEPSNPYRAGIASLFTRDFYLAAAQRLAPGGVFIQWVQAYEISAEAVRTAYATLGSAFPYVESWRTHRDLLLIATREPLPHDAAELRRRVAQEPYRSALSSAWRVAGAEGLLAHFVAAPAFTRAVQEAHGPALNTDDQNRLEFGFARAVGRHDLFNIAELRRLAEQHGSDKPQPLEGELDWAQVREEKRRLYLGQTDWAGASEEELKRGWAFHHYAAGDLPAAARAWLAQSAPPQGPEELALVAEGLAATGQDTALAYIDGLREWSPAEADAALGRLRLSQGRFEEAARALEAAFVRHRHDPWPKVEIMLRALESAKELTERQPSLGTRMYAALQQPFAARSIHEPRALMAWELASLLGLRPDCGRALDFFEPWVPWERRFLENRAACYAAMGDARLARARRDLAAFGSNEPLQMGTGLRPARAE
jgi:predicted membrane-bound spermidine synthase